MYADGLRAARHMVVATNGDLIVSAQQRGGTRGTPADSSGVWIFRDDNGDGKADRQVHFASGFSSSEVALFDGYLYTETTTAILRFPFANGTFAPAGKPDTVAEDLPGGGSHPVKTFAIDHAGNLFVNFGTATNSCQATDRQKEVPGKRPCDEVEIRGGIWKFDARKLHQKPSADSASAAANLKLSNHFARGIRNAVGIAINPMDGKLWTTQHGRDGLGGEPEGVGQWPNDTHYNAENPAEELLQVNQGDDFGWPYCYYAVEEHHLVLAPEYGGDGKKVGECAQKKEPVAVFPAHWAPNGLMFYTGSMFPAKYKSGAFIAFHGSWNRAPEPQAGIQRRVPAVERRPGCRSLRSVRRRLRPASAGESPAHRPGAGQRRFAVRRRRRRRTHLQDRLRAQVIRLAWELGWTGGRVDRWTGRSEEKRRE